MADVDMRYKSMSKAGKLLAIFLDLIIVVPMSFFLIAFIPSGIGSVIALVFFIIAITPIWYLIRIRKGE